jgi:1,4-dihydroxy-2-naphthoyl-CoA hydrolase
VTVRVERAASVPAHVADRETRVEADRFAALVRRLEAGETVEADELDGAEQDPFAGGVLGLRFDTVSLERLTAHLDIQPSHHQPYGIVHGGVWCAIVETMASFAGALHAARDGRLVVGVHNATDFLRAQREGRIEAEATPIHVGRTQQLWEVRLWRADDGKAVARGQVRLQAIEPERVAS